ncbi:MAG: hypothetical protein ACO2ZZ_07250 [Cyclobacteriaceae bacterium]
MYLKSALLMTVFTFFLSEIGVCQQSQNPYSDWMKENYPSTHENIKEMITRVYGNDNEKKFNFLIEFQAKSLYNIFDLLDEEKANWDLFSTALNQWTQSKVEDRGENWWEWPDTNWKKVESEYLFLLDTN